MSVPDLNILLADDDEAYREKVGALLESIETPSCHLDYLKNPEQILETTLKNSYDLVLFDYFEPVSSRRELYHQIRESNPQTLFVILTSNTDLELAISTMKDGVYDYLIKPLDKSVLHRLILMVHDHCQLKREISFLKSQIRNEFTVDNIIGSSPAILQVMNSIGRSSRYDVNVLVRGESGTGKELVARAIHYHSPRRNKPFITINIAALSESLIESELFGHVRGAFTGAESDRNGLFHEANGGTLFIDEVGDVSPAVQAKLLRLIQFKQYQKVGDNQTQEADVRIIAATSRNLEQMMPDDSFRSDLFYRLSVVSINVPPLRERRTDIPALIDHFIASAVESKKLPEKTISREAMNSFLAYDYPGNIRELQNAVEHGLVFSRNSQITRADLPETIAGSRNENASTYAGGQYQQSMDDFEKDLLHSALQASDGNQSEAARMLNMTERRLRYRLEKLKSENQV